MGFVYIIGGLVVGGLLFALLNKMFDIIATGSAWIGILAACFIVGAFLTGLLIRAFGSILKILLIIVGIIVAALLLYLLFKKLFGKSGPSDPDVDNNGSSANEEE